MYRTSQSQKLIAHAFNKAEMARLLSREEFAEAMQDLTTWEQIEALIRRGNRMLLEKRTG